jgi:NAD+ kinase
MFMTVAVNLSVLRPVEERRRVDDIGIVTRPRSPRIARALRELGRWLEERGKTVLFEETAFDRAPQPLASRPDLIISLGGDGTMLHAAKLGALSGAPILGVNFGHKGFLTQLRDRKLLMELERVLEGEWTIERRQMLEVSMQGAALEVARGLVLNDVVISKGAHPRAMGIDVELDGKPVLSMLSDGLVISTPTGSTAYSLAAGGPIVHPGMDALILTPVCPHTLTQRPLVVPSSVTVRVALSSKRARADVTLDGQIGPSLASGEILSVRAAPVEARFVRLPGRDYFEELRTKLSWGRA